LSNYQREYLNISKTLIMDKEQEKYIKDLEQTISQFLKPLKNIPFKIAIKAMSGCKVIPFDKNNPDDRQLLI
jgi:nicotinic acid phosphoribosyltransferase